MTSKTTLSGTKKAATCNIPSVTTATAPDASPARRRDQAWVRRAARQSTAGRGPEAAMRTETVSIARFDAC